MERIKQIWEAVLRGTGQETCSKTCTFKKCAWGEKGLQWLPHPDTLPFGTAEGGFFSHLSEVACSEIHPLIMLRFLACRILMLSSNTSCCFFIHIGRSSLHCMLQITLFWQHPDLFSWSLFIPLVWDFPIIVKWTWRAPNFGKHSQSVFYLSGTSSTCSLLALSTSLWGVMAVLFTEGLWVSRTLHSSVVTLVLTLNLSELSFSIHTTLLPLATLRGGCEGYMR